MPPVRALLAILIVLSHFSFFGVAELRFLRFLAPVCVSIFLFISGYGLMVSFQKKGKDYLQTFLQRRILKIALPAIAVSIIHLLLCGNGEISLLERIRLVFTKGSTLLPHYWFVWVILYEYLVFWFSFKILPGKYPPYSILFCTVSFTILTILAGFDRCWWICSLSFPTGLLFATYESTIFSFCSKREGHYWLVLGLSGLISAGLHYIGNPICLTCCYIFIPVMAALVIARIPLDASRLPVLKWIGTISYELYLIHITIMSFLRGTLVYISSDALYIAAVLCLSICFAYGIHLLCQLLTPKTN